MAKQQPSNVHQPFTPCEIATMLAALRRWQRDLEQQGENLTAFSFYFDDCTPLTVVEIDVLCEWLNGA